MLILPDAIELVHRNEQLLEGELQSQLNYTLAAFGQDSTEVGFGGGRVIKAASRITLVILSSAKSVGELLGKRSDRSIGQNQWAIDRRAAANCFQRQINVAVAGILVINHLRESLVEDIEESGAELQSLGLSDLEVLEQRDVPVLPIRRAEIERRNGRPRCAESRNADSAQIKHSLPDILSI